MIILIKLLWLLQNLFQNSTFNSSNKNISHELLNRIYNTQSIKTGFPRPCRRQIVPRQTTFSCFKSQMSFIVSLSCNYCRGRVGTRVYIGNHYGKCPYPCSMNILCQQIIRPRIVDPTSRLKRSHREITGTVQFNGFMTRQSPYISTHTRFQHCFYILFLLF